jgi:hypothetical protein
LYSNLTRGGRDVDCRFFPGLLAQRTKLDSQGVMQRHIDLSLGERKYLGEAISMCKPGEITFAR